MDNNTDNLIEDEEEIESEEKNTSMAVLVHILGLFTSVIGPLVIYMTTEEEFVKENAAQALNWQIMVMIILTLSFVLSIILIGFIGYLIIPINVIFSIIAAKEAKGGETWNYPATYDFV